MASGFVLAPGKTLLRTASLTPVIDSTSASSADHDRGDREGVVVPLGSRSPPGVSLLVT